MEEGKIQIREGRKEGRSEERMIRRKVLVQMQREI